MNIKNKSIEILEKQKCTGCEACCQICPENAITMEYNNEGFLYPIVDHNKCTNCGLCSKICPEIGFTFDNSKNPKCYAMEAIDEIRKVSSSGGMFTILSNYVFEKGGYVCGVSFNNAWEVEHSIIDKEQDLDKLRGSKYVQSRKGTVFKKIKKLLNENKLVLFSGCPCEVAGLKKFLMKDYDNLILVDLLCGSVQPPKMWEKYIKEDFKYDEIINIKFRDKSSYGWSLQLNVYFKDGNAYKNSEKGDIFCASYSSKLIARLSCLKCKYANLPRPSDITIADFWNIDKYDNKIYHIKQKSLGTSLVLSNNEKGDKIISDINIHKKNISLFNEIPLDFIKETCNRGIFTERNRIIDFNKRKDFYEIIKNHTFNKTTRYLLDPNYGDVGIIGTGGINNYGSIINAYAIYNLVKKLGYLPKMISYVLPAAKNINEHFRKKFHQKYIYRTSVYRYKHELETLNNKIDTFIAGSDQIWQYNAEHLWSKNEADKHGVNSIYFLSFANLDKKLISFSSSFGRYAYYGNYNNRLITSYYLSLFDHISVREDDAVDLCKEVFGINNVESLIEPVYLIEDEEWNNIISDSELKDKGKLAYYFLDPNENKEEAVKYISEKLGIDPIDANNNRNLEVEDFLYIMKNASFILTDSFHGTCFASIFKKKFISFFNEKRGSSRYLLFNKLGLQNRIIYSIDDIKNKQDLFDDIDYTTMDKVVDIEKEKSILWLKNALNSKKDKIYSPSDKATSFLLKENYNLRNRIINDENIINNTNKVNNEKISNLHKKYNALVNSLAWWIPIKKWRNNFRNKFLL